MAANEIVLPADQGIALRPAVAASSGPSRGIIASMHSIVRAIGLLSMVIGGLVLAGWAFHLDVLKSGLTGLAPMKANAAICFILAGAALGLVYDAQKQLGARRLGQTLALAVLLIGLLTLIEHLFTLDFGIDQLLFSDPPVKLDTHAPGRMVPVTAFNFVLMGAALMLLGERGLAATVGAQGLVLIVAFIKLLAFIAFIYDIEALYTFHPYSLIALPTVLTFLALCLGVLLARPEAGLMNVITSPEAGGVVARRMLPAALILPPTLGWLCIQGMRRGFYGESISDSTLVLLNMVLFSGLAWWSARSLNRMDAERRRAERELLQTANELTRSNTELEQFAYVSSHDLQEPLRAVAGCAQLLQRRYQGQLDARADDLIMHTVDGATRMQTLINDLLAYSRVGTRGRAFEPVALADALREALANLEVARRETQAVVTHDPLPAVLADRGQMVQLFQNLIGNAIKFRGERPPAIHVGARRAGAAWELTVRDNGIGIEPQYFERIFAVFQRLHSMREYPGTGIGLAICKKIIERHGGRVWVESAPGEGTTFHFTIPQPEVKKYGA